MQTLQITSETRDNAVLAYLSGEARNDPGEPLRNALAALAATEPDLVVLDLSGLSYIATVGLGELISFRERIAAQSGKLRLAGAEPHVTDLFERTRLREVFPIYPDAETALGGANG